MKSHWLEASPIVRRTIENTLDFGVPFVFPDGSELPSAATTWLRAAELAWSAGFDIEAPETPHSARHAELVAAGEHGSAIRYRKIHESEIDAERRAMQRWKGMRRWAAGPSAAELTEQARIKREGEVHAARVEARVQELLAEREAKERSKAVGLARAQAERELCNVDR
jgi:hypothetical protein